MKRLISLIIILVLIPTIFIGCSKSNEEESVETNSNNINQTHYDFGSDGWHKYRIRNKN